jgi:chromosomal replication initiator protein
MAKLDTSLWHDVTGYLRRRHAAICRHWFDQLQPLSLDAGRLMVQTESKIQQNYLRKKCADQFNEAAQAVTGALVAVQFVTPEDEAARAAQAVRQDLAQRRGQASQAQQTVVGLAHNNANASGRNGESTTSVAIASPPRRDPGAQTGRPDDGDPLEPDELLLSPDYVFDTFVSGPNNRLAYAAAVAVADQPGSAYNPLFIHGGVGLGKTHLLQGVCQQLLKARPDINICYLSCDAFMNRFLDCVQSGKMSEFRNRYRHVDVLVIDDIHFLAKRERSQEEFFHTFNALYQHNRQIILSSDSPPDEIPQLEERLVSRFQWGLITEVTAPCYETRLGIIRAKAKMRGLDLPDDVATYIAAKIESNARELEGALTKVQGYAALQDKVIDLDLAKDALGEPALEARTSQVTLQNIIDVVTRYYNVKLSDLQGKRRHKSITLPRQICMWLARQRTLYSLQEIGGYFGGRDHTTVMHSIRIIEQRMNEKAEFAQRVRQLDEQISQAK